MLAFIRYQLISYIRSFRFIAPTTIFLAWVFITYAYKNIPILSSYATTSLALYIIMTWIAMNVLSLEDESEKHILYVNLGGKRKYFSGKLIVCFIFITILTLYSHLFPILTNSFRGEVHSLHHFLSLYSHIILGIFGVTVGAFFAATKISSTRNAWLLSALIIVITIGYESILESMTYLKWLFVILPPVIPVISDLSMGDDILLKNNFWLHFSWAITYACGSITTVALLFLKFER